MLKSGRVQTLQREKFRYHSSLPPVRGGARQKCYPEISYIETGMEDCASRVLWQVLQRPKPGVDYEGGYEESSKASAKAQACWQH